MSEIERRDRVPDPEESPFEVPPIEGLPFEKGSEEDQAIQRIIEESGADRHRPE